MNTTGGEDEGGRDRQVAGDMLLVRGDGDADLVQHSELVRDGHGRAVRARHYMGPAGREHLAALMRIADALSRLEGRAADASAGGNQTVGTNHAGKQIARDAEEHSSGAADSVPVLKAKLDSEEHRATALKVIDAVGIERLGAGPVTVLTVKEASVRCPSAELEKREREAYHEADRILEAVAVAFNAAEATWARARRSIWSQTLHTDEPFVVTLPREVVPRGIDGQRFLELVRHVASEDRSFWSAADRPKSIGFRFAPPPSFRAVNGRSPIAGGASRRYYS